MSRIEICPCGIAKADCDYHKPQFSCPFLDVSSNTFIEGVTNFTLRNFEVITDLLVSDSNLTLGLDDYVYLRLIDYNVIDTYYADKIPRIYNTKVKVKACNVKGPISDSEFWDNDVMVAVLRTREY